MADLFAEIRADLDLEEIRRDFMRPVTWGGATVRALVGEEMLEEGFDDYGGPILSGGRMFRFKRQDLLAISTDLSLIGDAITYESRTYDVVEIKEDSSHPIVQVVATFRNNSGG